MPLGKERSKVAYGLAAKSGRHRYTTIRWVVGILFTVLVALLPLTGTLRFDLWGGRHMILGEEHGLVEAMKAFAFPFLAVNIGIILASRFVGRYLCGFVCPVGALGRLSEWVRWKTRKGGARWGRLAQLFGLCLLLAAITFSFWVDWRVFVDGSPTAITASGVFLGGLTVGLFGTIHWMELRFCRDWCPSGVYFAVLGHETNNGIEFANPSACTDCHACEKVCPMDLSPREIEGPTREGRGFYPGGLTNHALCIRCGDCVAACESTTGPSADTPLAMRWLHKTPEVAEDA